MAFLCTFGLHAWEGCKCSRCGKTRDEEHSWDGCKCRRCGTARDAEHSWGDCRCLRCGKMRDHSWKEGKCSRCGEERDPDPSGTIKCSQQENERIASLSCEVQPSDSVDSSGLFRGLASHPTTMLAATNLGRPALFVAADARYCYWPDDIGRLDLNIFCEHSPRPALMLKLSYRMNPISASKALRLDPHGCLKQSTYLYAFLQALRHSDIVLVLFEGDRNAVSRQWSIPQTVKSEVSQLLSAIDAGCAMEGDTEEEDVGGTKRGFDEAELPGIRERADVDAAVAAWKQCGDQWEAVAATLFDMVTDALAHNARDKAASLLVELADGFVSGTSPMQKAEFGIPSYPAQTLIILATRLYIGQEQEVLSQLAEFEKKFDAVQNDEVRAEYWAYEGWALSLARRKTLADEKFAKAVSLAASLSPASHACGALLKVANIMGDCGRAQDAVRTIDAADQHPDRMAEAVFSDREGVIPTGSSAHGAIARSWAQDLKDRLSQARSNLTSAVTADDVFLGYLLRDRKKQDLCDMLRAGDFAGAVGTIRRALERKDECELDLVLTLSTCAATVSQAADA